MAKRKDGRMNERTRLIIAFILVAVLVAGIYYFMGDPLGLYGPEQTAPGATAPISAASPKGTPEADGTLRVYVLDVGQGDCIFAISPSGKTMLVDTSTGDMYARIDEFLQGHAVEKLDVVVATHPHADHIGAMDKVITNYEVGKFYMPDAESTTKTFERMLDALEEKEVPVYQAKAGVGALIEWDEAIEVRILSPVDGESFKDLNDASVVLRLRYDETSILLTGDAEETSEKIMLREFPPSYLKATVLKVGHHGSSSSTSAAFFAAVAPEVAVISLGEDNSYGHPHAEPMELFEDNGVEVFRTDQHGTVHIILDGKAYTIQTEKEPA